MPAGAATTTSLAASFQGLGGATALSLIAFGIVFLVLGGLTLVIFAMRFVSKFAGQKPKVEKPKAEVSVPAKVAVSAPVASSVAAVSANNDELVAVIAAAIMAETGSAVSVKSITPVTGHQIASGVDGWISCARLEALQGPLTDGWN